MRWAVRQAALGLVLSMSSGCRTPPPVAIPAPPASAPKPPPVVAADEPAKPRSLASWRDAKCPARPHKTVKLKLDSCFAMRDNRRAWSCLQQARTLLDCGLRAEAHLAGQEVNEQPCSSMLPSEPTAPDLQGAGRRLACVLADQPHRGQWVSSAKLANKVRAAEVAASVLWEKLRSTRRQAPIEYSLVARGGVSLGNWQSGVLFYLSEVLKLRRDRTGLPSFSTVTGASAGAVNALASAISSCEKPIARPQDSLYYQTWINLGLFGRHGAAGLLPKKDQATTYGIFNRGVLDASKMRGLAACTNPDRFISSTGRSCQVRLGLTVTYLDERTAPVHFDAQGHPVIAVPRLKERFALKLQWDKRHRDGLRVTNLWPGHKLATGDNHERQFYALLGHPPKRDSPIAIKDVMMAVEASGAFPVAFPPVTLQHTDVTPQGAIGERRQSQFVDGGTLDNTPIGLAIKLDEWAARRDPNPYFERATKGRRRAYVFVDANATAWSSRERPSKPKKSEDRNVLNRYIDFGGTLIGASLQASLLDTVERWPFIQRAGACEDERCLLVPTRTMPITASLLGHFMAFLERDYRLYDFYAGMADGTLFVRNDPALNEEVKALAKRRGIEASSRQAQMLQIDSPELRCMLDYVARRQGGQPAAEQRMSRAQLPLSCKSLGHAAYEALGSEQDEAVAEAIEAMAEPSPPARLRHAEQLLAAHNYRALIVAMHNYHAWELSAAYDKDKATQRFFAELRVQDYRYADIPKAFGLIRKPGDASIVLRRVIHQATEALANAQPTQVSRATVRTISRFGGDLASGPIVPQAVLRMGVAPLGLDVHFGVQDRSVPLRPELGLRVYRISPRQIFPNERPEWLFDFTSYARLKVPLSPRGVPWLLLEPSVGAVFSETLTAADGHAVARAGLQNGLTAVVGQRFWLELDFEHFFPPLSVADQWSAPGVPELLSPRSRLSGAVGAQLFW